MGINYITFNNVTSSSLGVYVSGSSSFGAPEKDYETVSVPGRNGDLLIFNNRYNNIEVTYPAIFFPTNLTESNFETQVKNIRAWLMSQNGYTTLSDTYHPNEYRMATFAGPFDIETYFLKAGSCDLVFNCKPQRFLTSGDTETTYSTSGETISNPTAYTAKPILTVYGSGEGTVNIGSKTITISDIDSYVTLDCELCYAEKDTGNKNNTVSGSFPELAPGSNTLVFSGGVTSVKVKPRWWTL